LRLPSDALPEDSSLEISIKPPTFAANRAQGDRECVSGGHPNIHAETMPLPDLKLLELQWILHPVFALAGAAG
ncbi:hypothetical protein ACJ72_08611, partial [Emergomyces africanus]